MTNAVIAPNENINSHLNISNQCIVNCTLVDVQEKNTKVNKINKLNLFILYSFEGF